MFRCFNCGKSFDEPLEIQDNLGTIKEPPYKVSYVCPHCKDNHYKPFIKDSISRREVIDKFLSVMRLLNEFDYGLRGALSSTATDDSKLDFARNAIYEFLTVIAGDDELSLPTDIDEMIFDMVSDAQESAAWEALTRNIEGD